MNIRKAKVNDDFFENIDTEEKAYILGFIYADGCIRKKSENTKSLKISLSQSDIEHLKLINSFISTYKVKSYKTKTKISKSGIIENCEVSISSKKIFDDLSKYGLHERKSLTVDFPNSIPLHLMHHFIRGYFDGDGSVYLCKIAKRNSILIEVSICGTHEFLKSLVNNCDGYNQAIKKEKRRVTNCFKYQISSGKRCFEFYEYIYKNSSIYLKRKKDIFDHYFQERRSETIIALP